VLVNACLTADKFGFDILNVILMKGKKLEIFLFLNRTVIY